MNFFLKGNVWDTLQYPNGSMFMGLQNPAENIWPTVIFGAAPPIKWIKLVGERIAVVVLLLLCHQLAQYCPFFLFWIHLHLCHLKLLQISLLSWEINIVEGNYIKESVSKGQYTRSLPPSPSCWELISRTKFQPIFWNIVSGTQQAKLFLL